MIRPFKVLASLFLIVMTVSNLGCDSASLVPPPPAELSGTTGASAVSRMKSLEIVLGPDDTPERRIWAQVARQEAGVSRAGFRVSQPSEGDPPARQAELIREAAARGASALIVDPADAPQVADALNEVAARGVPVVLLDRTLPSRGKPFTIVTYPSFADSARQLVAAAIEDAKQAHLNPADGAILLVNSQGDRHTTERVESLRTALKEGGVPAVEPLKFDAFPSQAQKVLLAALAANPKIGLVLADEERGLKGAQDVRRRRGSGRPIILAGYLSVDHNDGAAQVNGCAGYVDRKVPALAARAVQAALSLARGQDVPARIELPLSFERPTKPDESTRKPQVPADSKK